jgi:hypothetical protein
MGLEGVDGPVREASGQEQAHDAQVGSYVEDRPLRKRTARQERMLVRGHLIGRRMELTEPTEAGYPDASV